MAEIRGGAAETLKRDLEARFTDGRIAPGAKLPTERALSEAHGISRNTVRRVLRTLEDEGWIQRHVGRGTFLRQTAGGEPVETEGLFRIDSRSVNPEEVMEARLLIEPLLARLIVSRATERELEQLEELVRRGGAAGSMTEFEQWDNRLHRALAAASKNKYLIQIVEGIHQTRQSAAWSALRRRGLTEDRRRLYQRDHERIVAALSARDGEAAESAIVEHLQNVRRNLLLI